MKENKIKKVLCFGDSNVYGFMPLTGLRYLKRDRWTGILQDLLGENYKITEAGANNRTAFCDNPAGENLTGYKALNSILTEQYDIIIISLGANDLQFQYKTNLEDFENGLKKLINISHTKCPDAKIVLASPSEIKKEVLTCFFKNMFDETSIKKSQQLAPIYEKVAHQNNCNFIDLNNIAQPSKKDGLHYDEEAHKKIAEALYSALKP